MGRQLYRTDPTFRAALDEAAAVADGVLEVPLLDLLYPTDASTDAGPLHDLSVTQPAMFALQWAMAALWRRFGVEPDAVMGHSTGQYVAACLAGVFDLQTGLTLMARRGRLMSTIDPDGAMVALFAPLDVSTAFLDGLTEVGVAAINGPAEVVISGRTAGIEAAVARAEAAGVEIRRLKISHAAHSPLVDPILAAHGDLFDGIDLAAPRIALVDNLTGQLADADLRTAAHWQRHLRQPVQFHAGMRTLVDQGYNTFVELGNHPVLCGAGARCVDDVPDTRFVPSLRRGQPDWPTLLEGVGRLWARGVAIDWSGVHADQPGAKVSLPGTVFQGDRHWVDRRDDDRGEVGRGWTYGFRWPEIRLGLRGVRSDAKVIILADEAGLGARIADRRREPCVLVHRGSTYGAEDPHYTVDPADPEQIDRLLSEAGAGPATHVIDLWPLDAGSAADHARAGLHVLQAAARHGRPEVWIVTRGAAGPTSGHDLDRAPLLGLATTAAVELDLDLIRIDLDPDDPDRDIASLDLVFEAGLHEDQIAVRSGQITARRLVALPAAGPPAPPIRSDATYLVTGGLGALGIRIAAWLADRGAGAVVLVSRSAPEGPAADRLAALATAHPDTTVVHRRADVGVDGAIDDVLASVSDLPPIVGVFHAAGVLDDASIPTVDFDRFAPVWHPKIAGARRLDAALPDAEVFVLLSSAASMIGSAGQANYASANAALDALARRRRALGRHALAIGFGPVAGAGLATATAERSRAAGVHPIAAAQAVAVMGQLLGSSEAEVAVVDVDWAGWSRAVTRVPQLVRDFAVPPEDTGGPRILATLTQLPPAQRTDALIEAVAGHVGTILGLPADEVDPDRGLSDLGMDSLMAVELANRLRSDVDPTLSVTIAFDHPTVHALATHLLETIAATIPDPPVRTAAPRAIDGSDPIAIVGMSCRMPGGANDPEAFWELLVSGTDPMIEVPPERWDLQAVYDPVPGTPGRMYTRWAGFVDFDQIEGFDPGFFGISPREAASLDPQQRMLLEVSTEALDRSGLHTDALKGSPTGVFVGVGDSGYLQRFQGPGEPLYRDAYAGTGSLSAFVSGRVAHALGLVGPNLAVNTACSSSLVAIHLAVTALRHGECDAALAGGVHLMLSPDNFVYVSQLEALAADGRCKTFDASADGYGRAEGCAMFVLERLSDAIERGDPILAVIRGSAIGHDGASAGLTVPNGPAQVQVLSAALARSGVDPRDVTYLEAHGTGTSLGDPIEIGAAAQVYGSDRELHLGAVKSNVGHLEVAAGAASLLKVVLALQHRTLPPHLHLQQPNPALDLAAHAMVIDTTAVPWEAEPPRRAGVSAFGLAGTNAHLVVEEAPIQAEVPPTGLDVHWMPISARSEAALRSLVGQYGALIDAGADWGQVALTAATTRRSYEHRVSVVASTGAEASAALATWLAHGQAPGVSAGVIAPRRPRVAWLFSGQGSQYPGMGRGLYEAFDAYREVVDRCAEVLSDRWSVGLLEILHADPEDPRIHDTTYTQAALFVHEVALAALWRSVGVVPDQVAGHSVGQIAAATVAGVFDLQDGLSLVAERGRLMGQLPAGGAMMAVFADEGTATGHLEPEVGIAAVNHGGEVVLSGPADALDRTARALQRDGIEIRPLAVSHAFHSALMEPIVADFEAAVARVALSPPTVPVMCNVTGGVATTDDLLRPSYWGTLIRRPVRFGDNLAALARAGADVLIEVGPHTALLGMAQRAVPDPDRTTIGSCRRGQPDRRQWLQGVGAAFCRGVPVDPAGIYPHRGRASLPTTPWQRRRCWIDAPEWPGAPAVAPGAPADWFVTEAWIRRPLARTVARGTWLLIGTGPIADALAAALSAQGAQVQRSAADPVFDPSPDRVVWIADPVGPAGSADGPVAGLDQLQALVRSGWSGSLAWVTRGAVAAAGPPSDPGQGALWGLLRVIRLEHAALAPVGLDLDPADPGDPAAWISALVDGAEPEQALRGSDRYVRRIEPMSPPAPASVAIDGGGTYLVTGGLRGLGLEIARWLADRGAAGLVLTSRSAPNDDALEQIAAIEGGGTAVTVARGDVADADDVDRILASIDPEAPLKGIVHAAGVLADASLMRLDRDAVERVFAPKVAGTHHLYVATADRALDFFVLFSGGASMLGSPGQGNYAAANAYLDAFAPWARAAGHPVTAIAWGAWADVGMAARLGSDHANRQAAEGVGRIDLASGLMALGQLLASPRPQVGVLPIDWPRLVATFHRGVCPVLLAPLVAEPAPPVAPETALAAPPSLPELVAGHPPSAWPAVVAPRVEALAVAILGLDPDPPMDRSQPLLDRGLDSLMAVELKNALMDAGVDVPVAPVMTGPSIDRITALVIDRLEVPAAAARRPRAPDPERTHPIATHALAFVIGIVVAVGAYVITAAVVGPAVDPPGVIEAAPDPGRRR